MCLDGALVKLVQVRGRRGIEVRGGGSITADSAEVWCVLHVLVG